MKLGGIQAHLACEDPCRSGIFAVSLFGANSFVPIQFQLESLILAQNERWRRA
jgi:hypothetical protein